MPQPATTNSFYCLASRRATHWANSSFLCSIIVRDAVWIAESWANQTKILKTTAPIWDWSLPKISRPQSFLDSMVHNYCG